MIQQKLLQFAEKKIKVKKDAKNPFFKNDYTTLNEVLDKVSEPLQELGVVIIQSPQIQGLETRLVDTEDETEIISVIPYFLPEDFSEKENKQTGEIIRKTSKPDMQKLGGAITYARRYALISMLNLESEDDDGNTATGKKKINNNEDIDY